jgi:hypothetical protein
MKTIKLLIPAMALMLGCMAAKASGGNDSGDLAKKYAISVYVDAMTHGKLSELDNVLDPAVKFTMPQGNHISTYNKKKMMEFFQTVKGIEEDCTINTSVVENNANMNVVKVDMQFKDFVRSNYVTLANTDKGWKIINVYTVFN